MEQDDGVNPFSNEDVKKYFMALTYNSLYGFQFDEHTNDYFILCYCSEDLSDATVQRLKETCNVPSLKHGDFLGHGLLKIHMRDYSLENVAAIFSFMLANRLYFQTRNIASVHFGKESFGKKFTFELMEHRFIDMCNEFLRMDNNFLWSPFFARNFFKPYNYLTQEGVDFCVMLRNRRHKKAVHLMEQSSNWFKWLSFQEKLIMNQVNYLDVPILKGILPYAKKTSAQSEEKNQVQVKEDKMEIEEDTTCIVCMTEPVTTKVLPCNHSVACAKCSENLKGTLNANQCIYCRSKIEKVVLL
jgi:hypothetical protein